MVKSKTKQENVRTWIQEALPVEARIPTQKTAVGMTSKAAEDRSQGKTIITRVRKKQQHCFKETAVQPIVYFSVERMDAKRQWMSYDCAQRTQLTTETQKYDGSLCQHLK